jgi:hypothetical protein
MSDYGKKAKKYKLKYLKLKQELEGGNRMMYRFPIIYDNNGQAYYQTHIQDQNRNQVPINQGLIQQQFDNAMQNAFNATNSNYTRAFVKGIDQKPKISNELQSLIRQCKQKELNKMFDANGRLKNGYTYEHINYFLQYCGDYNYLGQQTQLHQLKETEGVVPKHQSTQYYNMYRPEHNPTLLNPQFRLSDQNLTQDQITKEYQELLKLQPLVPNPNDNPVQAREQAQQFRNNAPQKSLYEKAREFVAGPRKVYNPTREQ